MPTSPNEMIQRTVSLSQHEAAHWIIAIAVGFEAHEITLKVQSLEAHRGKANTISIERIDTIEDMLNFVRRRALVKLSGAMGEAIDRDQMEVDGKAAKQILEDGETGAAQDYAVARELTLLLHNSMPAKDGFSSGDLLLELIGEALAYVTLNMKPICDLADALTRKVVTGRGTGEVGRDEIYQLALYCQLP